MGQRRSAEHRDFSPLAAELSHSLLAWWEVHGRKDPALKPWMFTKDGRWPEPHEHLNVLECWIAEVMLQQTQLAVVLPFWTRWMTAFPTLEVLAAASLDDVRLQWQGLGYYSRVRRLHEAAQILVGGPWPRSLEEWMALPGIGRTTAGSILSSAFNAPLPILDGNVKRVLARLTAHPRPPARDEGLFWSWSEALLDPDRPRDTNQALMDLGATLCTPRQPSCNLCPWLWRCAAYASGDPCRWPVTDAPKPLPFKVIGVGVVLNTAGEVLIDQRLEEGLLGGMWEFPGGKQEEGETIETCIARELKEELGIAVTVGDELITVDHAYSHKKLRFVVHLCDWVSGEPQPLASQQVRWVRPDDLNNFAFPAANAKIIAALLGRLSSSAHS
ncbi:8-oxo-dGTP diphosphatase MutT [Synechococcus sp. PROS-U-1]|uniref:8-oxo-dGTP diphosphatase MutT n=1 Tax=Synechococcus sp. PROS-U-1 TaxID=1400866 RepID=UPI001645221F|nr:8-oxo-dGTP diphosphatase MutT [Synechococcus sp. PROS-U-1]QNJ01824.1 A/G-specific DNA glycosylase [Synechococcus sp. PROS-U-1]